MVSMETCTVSMNNCSMASIQSCFTVSMETCNMFSMETCKVSMKTCLVSMVVVVLKKDEILPTRFAHFGPVFGPK